MPKLIKTWEELSKCTSPTHHLEIDIKWCNGWIIPNTEDKNDIFGGGHYLSTHTFYGKTHEYSTKLLQSCGFDVVIDNWDKEESK